MVLELWDFLTITVIASCLTGIITTYIKAKYKFKEKEKKTKEDDLVGGLILLGVGLAIFLGLYWSIELGPWLIAGMVPAFVGMALIISYFVKKSKS